MWFFEWFDLFRAVSPPALVSGGVAAYLGNPKLGGDGVNQSFLLAR